MSAVKLLMTVTLMLPVLITLEATAVGVWLALTEVASTVQVNSKINTILSCISALKCIAIKINHG